MNPSNRLEIVENFFPDDEDLAKSRANNRRISTIDNALSKPEGKKQEAMNDL